MGQWLAHGHLGNEQKLVQFHENVVFGFTISAVLTNVWLQEEMQ